MAEARFDYHRCLIKARNQLQYRESHDGKCYGIGHVSMQYALTRNLIRYNQIVELIRKLVRENRLVAAIEEKQQFYLEMLHEIQTNILNEFSPTEFKLLIDYKLKKLNRDKLNVGEQNLLLQQEELFYQLSKSRFEKKFNELKPAVRGALTLVLDIPPFFNSIECYQQSHAYQQLGSTNKSYQDAGSVMQLLLPDSLKTSDSANGLDIAIAQFSGSYSSKELEFYFSSLRKIIDDHGSLSNEYVPVALILENSNHAICVSYDDPFTISFNKQWFFNNAGKAVAIDHNEDIATAVGGALSHNDVFIFSTKVYVPPNASDALKEKLKNWIDGMKQIYDPNNLIRATQLDSNKCNWLHIAARVHHPSSIEIVKGLLSHGDNIDPNLKDGSFYSTALLTACKNNISELVALLLTHPRIDPNEKDRLHNASLLIACSNNNLELATLLLNHPKIDPNTQNANGETPLIIACASGNVELVEKLLAHKDINIRIKNNDCQDALYAALINGHTKVIELLLLKGASASTFYSEGTTPLLLALKNGKLENIKLLIKHHADINTATLSGRTALSAAVRKKDIEAVRLLLEAGANANQRLGNGQTPLHIAAAQNDEVMVALLLQYKAKQVIDYHGDTPGDLAKKANFQTIVKIFESYDFNINQTVIPNKKPV